MLQFGERLARACPQQRGVPALTGTHPVDLRIDALVFAFEVLGGDLGAHQIVARGVALLASSASSASLGEVRGAMGNAGQLSIEISQIEELSLAPELKPSSWPAFIWYSTVN